MNWARRARNFAALTVLCAIPSWPATPAVAGQTATYFSATTTASAVHLSFTQSPADSIITGSLVDTDLGYATSVFNTDGSSEASASPVYPGSLVVGGPGLLCTDLFSCPFTPPTYPLVADASYPRDPAAHIVSAKPAVNLGAVLSIAPAAADARANPVGNASTTSTGKISLLGGTPLAVTIGASTASTRVRTAGVTMTVDVISSLTDIRISPLLHIGSLRTSDSLTLTPNRPPTDRPTVTLTGVTVAGHAATITRTGLQGPGHGLAGTLAKLLHDGITVRTLGIARTDHGRSARSSAGGVEIDFSIPLAKAPYLANPLAGLPGFDQIPGIDLKGTYLGSVQLGGAGAVGSLQRQASIRAPRPASTTGRSTPPPASNGRAGSTAGSAEPTGASATVPPSAPEVASPQPVDGIQLIGLSRIDLSTLYLVLAIGTATIFLGWRGSLALRARRAATRPLDTGMQGRRRQP